jgi:S-DNA-T family DNA segregation ATPase FtsK/SpoIIIE
MSKKKKKSTSGLSGASFSLPRINLSPKDISNESWGLLLWGFSLISLVSLSSFSDGNASVNTLGLVGHLIAFCWHYLLGLGSYPANLFLAYTGWKLVWHGEFSHWARKTFLFSVWLISFCLLVNLFAEHYSKDIEGMFGRTVYSEYILQEESWTSGQTIRYYLGGSPAYRAYMGPSPKNLHHLLSDTGIVIVFGTIFFITTLRLTGLSIVPLLSIFFPAERKGSEQTEKKLDLTQQPDENSFLRFVKLRIPSSLMSADGKSPKQDYLEISPEKELTERPSLSRKGELNPFPPLKSPLSSLTSLESLTAPISNGSGHTERTKQHQILDEPPPPPPSYIPPPSYVPGQPLQIRTPTKPKENSENPAPIPSGHAGRSQSEETYSFNPNPTNQSTSNRSIPSAIPSAITPPFPASAMPPVGSQGIAQKKRREEALRAQTVVNGDFSLYQLPSPNLLTSPKKVDQTHLKKGLRQQAEVLEETLMSFGIEAKVGEINCGPTITSFEVHPSIGVKVQKIKALENDIALNMEATTVRIIAPIPGKAAVGIEVPNAQPQEVAFKELLQAYQKGPNKLEIPVLLGKAVNGDHVVSDLTKMPHVIIAGATGSGKSVCINTIIMSILMNAKPDEIQLVMVDPKKVELTPYTRLPHMIAPVITEPKGACAALNWLVKEMEKRYEILKQVGVRNIKSFNARTIDQAREESLPIPIPKRLSYILCIIDELADLMMVSGSDIETPIARIAQMARAVGIHMILATQRPSREVITGIIKANFPTRISFKVSSRINSAIILDENGAEALLGNGDMLFLPPGTHSLLRAQGAFIRDEDINQVVNFICRQAPPRYQIESFDDLESIDTEINGLDGSGSSSSAKDSMYEQAREIVNEAGMASTSFLQRKLKIGYSRAASLIDELEEKGVIGKADGAKPRKVMGRSEGNEKQERSEERITDKMREDFNYDAN